MKLTPLDIRKQTFRHKAMRGFDPEEVRIFLDMAADEYEKLLQDNGMLSEKVRYLSERLDEYHNLEKTLQSSILTAERVAAESRERSRIEAQTIINDAHVRSERILDDARSRLRQLSEQLRQLSSEKDLFLQRFHALLDGHAKFLASQQADLDAIDALDARARSLIANGTSLPAGPGGSAGLSFDGDRGDALAGESDEGPAPQGLEYRGEPEQDSYRPAAFEREETERESPADPPKRRFTDPARGRPTPPGAGADYQRIDARFDARRGATRSAFPPESPAADPAGGLYPPVERAEGFFELNARPNSEGGPQQ